MTAETKPDLRTLPFGLKRYRPGVFEKLHACGSGMVTASQVAALFGESPYAGRFATLAHVKGIAPIKHFGNERAMDRGTRLEAVALEMLAEERPWFVHQCKAWKAHDRIERMAASPDGVAWQPAGGHPEPGIVEVKTVSQWAFDKLWQDGPPLGHELQHQTQYACTGAKWGCIVALIHERWDLIVYDTEPRPDVIGILEAEVETALAKLDAGDLGAPDEHEASIRAAQRLWAPDPDKVLSLNEDEADQQLAAWLEARDKRLEAEKAEKTAKAYFAARAVDAGVIRCPSGGSVVVTNVFRKAYQVAASESRRLTPKPAKGDNA